MKRQELAHILRAACAIAGDHDVLVIGSQSILGTFDEDDLPAPATASIEADGREPLRVDTAMCTIRRQDPS